jgi:excisionase family DNA binding protein
MSEISTTISADSLGLISVDEAASLLNITPRTLRRWRQQRVGPRAVFIGRSVKYQMSELQAWINNSQSHYRPTHARPSSKKGV